MFSTIYIHTYQTKDGHVPTLEERLAMRRHCGPYEWTPRNTAKSDGFGFYAASNGLAMGDGPCTLRLELANDHLTGRLSDTRGYYTNSFCDETVKPIIARLPHGRGYLAGYTLGRGMASGLETDLYDSPESAAHAAHSIAENVAELNREDEEQYQAELDAEENADSEDDLACDTLA